jgi:hypothetical protein
MGNLIDIKNLPDSVILRQSLREAKKELQLINYYYQVSCGFSHESSSYIDYENNNDLDTVYDLFYMGLIEL